MMEVLSGSCRCRVVRHHPYYSTVSSIGCDSVRTVHRSDQNGREFSLDRAPRLMEGRPAEMRANKSLLDA